MKALQSYSRIITVLSFLLFKRKSELNFKHLHTTSRTIQSPGLILYMSLGSQPVPPPPSQPESSQPQPKAMRREIIARIVIVLQVIIYIYTWPLSVTLLDCGRFRKLSPLTFFLIEPPPPPSSSTLERAQNQRAHNHNRGHEEGDYRKNY